MTGTDFQGPGIKVRRMKIRKSEEETSGLIYSCCTAYPSNCIHHWGITNQIGGKNDLISFPVTSVMARRVYERGSHECMSETHLTDFLPGNSSDKTIASTTLQAKEQRLRIPGEKSVGHPIVSVAWNIIFIFIFFHKLSCVFAKNVLCHHLWQIGFYVRHEEIWMVQEVNCIGYFLCVVWDSLALRHRGDK